MVKQKEPVEVEFSGKELIVALEEALAFVKEESRIRKLEKKSREQTVLSVRKPLAANRLRVAAAL